MAAYFFDTSALVKRYASEIGTAWVFSLVRPAAANRLYLARITGAEVVSALTRRERKGRLGGSAATKALARFEREFANRYAAVTTPRGLPAQGPRVEVSVKLVSEAMKLARTYALRGYDAVQLAAALEVHRLRSAAGASALTLISADDALNAAAVAEGLAVDNPNHHPQHGDNGGGHGTKANSDESCVMSGVSEEQDGGEVNRPEDVREDQG